VQPLSLPVAAVHKNSQWFDIYTKEL